MIIIVRGPKEKAEYHVKGIRSNQISEGKGCLVVIKPHADEHKVEHQIEKLLAGQKLFPGEKLLVGESHSTLTRQAPKDLEELNWKKEPVVIVYGHDEKVLEDFEDVLPGFKKFFGPVSEITVK
jgi:hypothetical protein